MPASNWQISHQSLAIDFTSHLSSRQHQSSHVSHENVTQSPNPFQHYLQCSGHFTSLACASPHNPPRRFACLRARTALQMRLRHCRPSPSSPLLMLSHPALTIFMLTWCPPDMLLTPLMILTLMECPPDMLPTPLILTLV
ncbi:hypothetical protein O181_128020 [Austropuccinia psidii MF-1]|uniref:Uncharacterized protein n=1 Tax=Austropuccinia psidii MF-1 TaxID=1389203 RepID=A0A9Q3Q8L2_9BASI|nr:hypothetical protein [Austropuccinia psidii MF-1]